MNNQIWLYVGIVIIANMITFFLLWIFLHTKGRKPPLGIVQDGIRMYYLLYLKRNKRYYYLNNIEGTKIWYADWDRGIGYGYMDPPFKLGDVILVTANKPNKYHLLMVYRLSQPDPDKPEYFIFKTFYYGSKYVKTIDTGTAEHAGLGSFQRYD